MATKISDRAEVDPRAEIGDEVEIGPFCVVGPQVRIGRGSKLLANVTILGRVTIGEENKFYPGAVIGAEPQDLSYRGSDTQVVIGDGNVFREAVTVNRATEKESGVTSIGNDCFLMACSPRGSRLRARRSRGDCQRNAAGGTRPHPPSRHAVGQRRRAPVHDDRQLQPSSAG